jgi:hypothetical protein
MQIDSEKIEKSRKTLSSFFFTIFGLEVLNGYETVISEVFAQQPNILSSILVQQQMGNTLQQIEVLLHILIVTWLSIKYSGHTLKFISEDEQDKHLKRYIGHIKFWEPLPKASADEAMQQYLNAHKEKFLFAYVHAEVSKAGFHLLQKESSKYLSFAAFNLINCVSENMKKVKLNKK